MSELASLNYTDSDPGGDKTPVVLIHGVGNRLNSWDPLIPWLSKDFRVIAYDLRGHGDSAKPAGPYTPHDMVVDYVNLLDRLGVKRAHVVGQSLGGMIAQAVAIEAPDRVDRVVILSAVAGRNEAQQASVRARADLLREYGPAEMARRSIDRWFSKEVQEADPTLIERTVARFAANDPAGYLAAYEMFAENDLLPELGRIEADTLVATGEGDEGSSPEMAYRMGRVIPNSRVFIFPGVKHDIFEGDNAPVCSVIVDFLLGPSADGGPASAAEDSADGAEPGEADRFTRGLAARKRVLGDAYVEAAMAAASPFEANFQRMVTEYAWGECWADETLSWTMRSALNLGMTAALGRMEEFELHFRGALRNGLTENELAAILTQIAVYCGIPAGVSCFRIAREILRDAEHAETEAP